MNPTVLRHDYIIYLTSAFFVYSCRLPLGLISKRFSRCVILGREGEDLANVSAVATEGKYQLLLDLYERSMFELHYYAVGVLV